MSNEREDATFKDAVQKVRVDTNANSMSKNQRKGTGRRRGGEEVYSVVAVVVMARSNKRSDLVGMKASTDGSPWGGSCGRISSSTPDALPQQSVSKCCIFSATC